MADRTVENSSEEVPEIPEMLENVLLFALDEAKEKMEEGAELVPFTTLVVKENLFIARRSALLFLAERWGFEPQIPFWGIHDFQSCSFGQLGHLSVLPIAAAKYYT